MSNKVSKVEYATHTVLHKSSQAASRIRRCSDHTIRIAQRTHDGARVWVQRHGLPSAYWDLDGTPGSSTVGPLDMDTLAPITL